MVLIGIFDLNLNCVRINTSVILSNVFYLYVFLKPFYFWSSGLPQVGDILIILFLPVFILVCYGNFKFYSSRHKRFFVFSFAFLTYCLLVNIFWSIKQESLEPLLYSFYLYFNYYVVLLIYNLRVRGYFSFEKLIIALFFSSVFLVLYSIFNWQPGFRQVATFNNPNQLGAYAMLSTIIVLYFSASSAFKDLKIIYRYLSFLLVLLNVILVVISFSAGAIFATACSLLFIFMRNFKKYIPLVLFFLLSMSGFFVALYNSDTEVSNIVKARTDKKEQSVSIFYERGYDRMLNHLEYNFFGAGEGARHRLNSYIINDVHQLEIHSTVGTLVFSYGLMALFYLIFLVIDISSRFKHNSIVFLIIALTPYLLTHNLLRHPLLWMFILMPLLCQIIVFHPKESKV